MLIHRQHRLLGSILLLPFVAWSLTGIFFLIRPAYEEAYAPLSLKTYAAESQTIEAEPQWQEVRLTRTILGQHMLVKEQGIWRQIDPESLLPRPVPSNTDLKILVADAISQNPLRFGELEGVEEGRFRTTTGASINVHWDSLALYQRGSDTDWIDLIYSIHYLQWTGIAILDTIVGVVGLLLLLLMTVTGSLMLFRKGQ